MHKYNYKDIVIALTQMLDSDGPEAFGLNPEDAFRYANGIAIDAGHKPNEDLAIDIVVSIIIGILLAKNAGV